MNAAPPFDQSPIPFVGTVHRALIYRVHDGDTLWPVVDVGFGSAFSNPEKGIRLVGPNAKGFNTPELSDPNPTTRHVAKLASLRVTELTLGKYVYVESWPPRTDDKYGRWLMAVYVPNDSAIPETWTMRDPADVVSIETPSRALVNCFDLASQLMAEGLGEWRDFGNG